MINCWEVFSCNQRDCPAFGNKKESCFLLPNTKPCPCWDKTYVSKIEVCINCKVFKLNTEYDEEVKSKVLTLLSSVVNEYHNIFDSFTSVSDEFESITFEIAKDEFFLPIVIELSEKKREKIKNYISSLRDKKSIKKLYIDISKTVEINSEFILNLKNLKDFIKLLGVEVVFCGISPKMAKKILQEDQTFCKEKIYPSLADAIKDRR